MSKTNRKSKPEIMLPPITVMEDEARRLNALASSSAMLFPRVAHFLRRRWNVQAWWRAILTCAAWSAWARRSGTAMTRPVKSGTWCWCIRTKRT